MHLPAVLSVLCIALLSSAIGAFIEFPGEVLMYSGVYIIGQEDLGRVKREVYAKGAGTKKEGFVGFQGRTTVYEDDKTKLDGTVKAQSEWQKPYPPQHAAMGRLDGKRTVFENDKTKVTGSGFLQREVATGMRPHDSFGAGVGVTHNIYKGKNGELDVFGGYQREWNTPNKHSARGGIRWRF